MTLPVYPPEGGGGGGGGSRTGGSTGATVTAVPFGENGGFSATAFLLFVPAQFIYSGSNAFIGTFSPGSYNDANDGSSYSYRQEDVIPHRVPTVRRVVITYRNLGTATLTMTVSAVDDNGVTQSKSQTQTIGNVSADQTLLTAFFDITITGFRPQLSWSRAAAGGPISIIRATLIGEVEDVTL